MKILFLDSIEAKTYGGMEEWIRLVADGLARREHKVTVCGRPGSEFLRRVASSTSNVATLELNLSGDFNPVTISKLKSFMTDNGIDIVSVNFNRDVRLGGLASHLGSKAKTIWSVGLDITSDGLIHRLLTPKLVDGVIVPSSALKKQITLRGYIRPNIVEVIPIGISEADVSMDHDKARGRLMEQFDLPADAIIAVTSGRFVDQKGHRYLVDAATEIVNKFPMVRFLWLGDGPLREALSDQVEQLSLHEYFIMPGMQDNTDEFLVGADLMVHPSIEEPFGIVLAEAMRTSLPVVASRVGGIPEVVAENKTALLVEPRDRKGLASAVIKMVGSKELRASFGMAGYERWQKFFGVEMMIDRVEDCFTKAIQTEPAHGKA